MAIHGDPALDALMLPFASGDLARAPGAVFLRARAGAALVAADWPGLACEAPFRPDADALVRAGFTVADEAVATGAGEADVARPLVLVLPPRQRDEARALFAEALSRAAPGAMVVASVANDAGAKSAEADFVRIAGPVTTRSKHKCRVFWAAAGQPGADPALAAQWRDLDAPRQVAGGRFLSRPGVFAWDRIDAASGLLARHLPADLAGRAADLGAGYGYLAAELLERSPGISALDAYEADARALAMARHNLAGFASRAALGFHWHDVVAGVPGAYDVVVTNPPFHAPDGRERPDIGRAFIAAAAQALRPGGRLWLVANRHLPYEQALGAGFGEARLVAQEGGFKVVEAVKAGGARGGRPPR
ncbi:MULTISPECIES: class I SAM-dependent methyltransferase [unclassified Luteimonas]|uniref:class I SAM-dependent methyltransferase n=1 Tax=unclassified Luteimonas TaxID=2629088 RepID=UPI0018F0C092|nr:MULTISPECIES: class I SAM-dependent methyltransferase [unclassified Luteimonas]MBJ6979980.1 class I SAM-dependent methyltransferase [Luteimonas sp. MC1895]MBJ6983298.1 class I SAM-dependent methyltransferase [Luteimonas sp. MC1750]QQO06161.1 class I SAM-dependent methyltransferase [Luteimonas sp. MC1750]